MESRRYATAVSISERDALVPMMKANGIVDAHRRHGERRVFVVSIVSGADPDRRRMLFRRVG